MRFFNLLAFFVFLNGFAQKPCEFAVNVNDSIGQYKSTPEYLMYEKNFAGKSAFIFTSITVSEGLPVLNIQFLEKSRDFIKTRCFDANSRLYLQLENGKIVTLLHINQENCGSMVRDDAGNNNRILAGYFLFRKDDADFLRQSPISLMRVKFATETTDYIIKNSFKAELDGRYYTPSNYFVDYYHCINESR